MFFSAQEKEVTIKDPRTGKNQVVVVKVWNETVANLTLMALGSSAPEIMLSVIEIWAKGFEVIDNWYCFNWSKLVQIGLNVSKPVQIVIKFILMALGSSAPEIMLSVIEIWAKGFEVCNYKFDNIENENGPNLSIFV